ncbi:DsbE family thiol:disulfide interchange protein [Sphingomonas sp. GCM10030256]|uniref:DsbE family thiol:disulfide interchange protein n=1 Tax=Sphingomonas sp. GCM10030256 TaxID=3273427 RepID=UPI0036130683
MTRRAWLALPLVVFAIFLLVVGWRLSDPPQTTIKSRLIGQPVPAFALPAAVPGQAALSSADFKQGDGPRLLNLFASWCVPCIAEAPVLLDLKRRGVRIDGIAIRDAPEDVARFLSDHGNPFEHIGSDLRSRVQMSLGSAGVPESFVVNANGIITYQHIGPIMPQDVPVILAELEKAR